jgi:RecJ-like exonuclease
MKAEQRLLKDIEGAMRSVKEHAKRSALRSGSIDDAMKAIDRSTEMMFIVECEKLNRIYHAVGEQCGACRGRKRCLECSGRGKRTGLFMEGACRACKGTGVCQGCVKRSDAILSVLKRACVYARLRETRSFEGTLKKMKIDLRDASVYQGIVKIAEGR